MDHRQRMVAELIGTALKRGGKNGDIDGRRENEGRWQKPPDSMTKVNVDGSSTRALMRADLRCVIRSSQGKWLGGVACNLGYMVSLTAELQAIRASLLLAWRHGAKEVVLESDSSEIEVILGGSGGCKRIR